MKKGGDKGFDNFIKGLLHNNKNESAPKSHTPSQPIASEVKPKTMTDADLIQLLEGGLPDVAESAKKQNPLHSIAMPHLKLKQ